MLEFDGQNACDHFEPVLHPATKPSPSPPPRRGSSRCMPTRSIVAGVRFRVPSGDTGSYRTSTGNGRSAYRQTKTSPTVYRSSSESR